jgi:pyridoxamine 5'-phosphate oxidase
MTDPRDMQPPIGFHPDRPLSRRDLGTDPVEQFRTWLGAAEAAGIALPNAMALATAGADGRPTVRHVLLRGLDDRGFVFFTNRESRKGGQLAENPHAGLVFLWKELDRQVGVTGSVEPTTEDESDAYFAGRPRDARLGAWASRQSTVLAGRAALDAALADVEERFRDADVPRPPFWGGYRVRPETVEFWQGRRHRLHDRFRYTRDDGASGEWRLERLAP